MPGTNSQFDPVRIEGIVREVLRRLTSAQALQPSSTTGPAFITPCSTSTACSNSTTVTDSSVFECREKLVALQTLRGKLDNIKTLRLKPKTIVTPAARDELRDRKINILFDLGAGEHKNGLSTILLGTTCRSTGNKLKDQIGANGKQVQLHVDASASQLAKTVGNAISSGVPALIVTDRPHTAACIANRNANVRAVFVRDQSELADAKPDLNPNCVVLNSSRIGQINLSSILQQLS